MIKADLYNKRISFKKNNTTSYQLYDGRVYTPGIIEHAVIKTSAVLRLNDIKQLGLVNRVFPGASHTRFSHTLSATEIAGRMYDSIISKYKDVLELNQDTINYYRTHLCLQMIMHDTGHGPHSHEFEDAAKAAGHTFEHEHITDQLLRSDEFLETTYSLGYNFQENNHVIMNSIVKQIKDSIIDADKMDYHLQDAYFCGIATRFDRERIIGKLELVNDSTKAYLAINRSGIDAFEEFMNLRARLHHSIYCNPETLIYRMHLTRYLSDYIKTSAIPIETMCKLRDYDIDRLVEDGADSSIDAKAILESNPFKLVMDSRSPHTNKTIRHIQRVLVEKFGKENIILLKKDIDVAGAKLKKKPFYVVHDTFSNAVNILDLLPHLKAQKNEKHIYLYVNPDILGEAKTELGRLLE